MKKYFLTTLILSLFLFTVANAAVTFKMTFVDDYNDDSVPTVAAGNNFTCYFWIDPGTDEVQGFSICVSYPEDLILPTNLDDPFTDAGYISGGVPIDNTNHVVAGGPDKLTFAVVAFGPTGSVQGKMASVEFQAIVDIPVTGVIQWCGLGTPDPDTGGAVTECSIEGESVTPVPAIDKSLPIVLSSFTAFSSDKGVVVSWRTESEINNSGSNVYRSESRDSKFVKINPEMLKGAGISAEPHEYKFVDEAVEPGYTYYYYLKSIDFSGDEQQTHVIKVTIDLKGAIKVDSMLGPQKSMLLQNYPNPFNPETWIPFQLAEPADVTIRIYNINGRLIRILDVGYKDAGYYLSKGTALHWDGKDQYGELVSSGIYFYAISAGDLHAVKKLIIMK